LSAAGEKCVGSQAKKSVAKRGSAYEVELKRETGRGQELAIPKGLFDPPKNERTVEKGKGSVHFGGKKKRDIRHGGGMFSQQSKGWS